LTSDRLFDDRGGSPLFDDIDAALRSSPAGPTVRGVATRRSALWAAYGDALGWISELTDEAGLRRRTNGKELRVPVAWKRHIGGRGGVNAMLPAGCYSDDTQLRIATGRAIGATGFDVEAFAKVELPVWLGYALGGGTSTKAAAANLAKPTTSWFLNTYPGWLESGGNGAAMRIQPLVWSARQLDDPSQYLLPVFRNAICTHAHPVGLMGAVLHAVCLAYTLENSVVPQPGAVAELIAVAVALPASLGTDDEVGQFWLARWEHESGQSFTTAWKAIAHEAAEIFEHAADAAATGTGAERYGRVIGALGLRDPDRRGSGLSTAIAAVALTWCEERPPEAMALAANTIGTDTDTIATMAGALLGVVADSDPILEVLDAALIRREADRMTSLASGDRPPAHRYPDLLTWSAPKTQADALAATPDGSLYVVGLGPVSDVIGDPLPASQGGFLWQWVKLATGQTLLIKRRRDLAVIHQIQQSTGETRSTTSSRKEETEMSVTERPQREPPGGERGPSRSSSAAGSDMRPNRPLDLERVMSYVESEGLDDRAIGYAVRRVAREGTTGQVAAFLGVLLERLRLPK
jgi:ADP-ribosylglycohydrolase